MLGVIMENGGMIMFKHVQCPKCGYANIVHTHIYKNTTVVFDACNKCGTKTTKEEKKELEIIKTEE